eukprot:3378865-Rhodomonas_salina.1
MPMHQHGQGHDTSPALRCSRMCCADADALADALVQEVAFFSEKGDSAGLSKRRAVCAMGVRGLYPTRNAVGRVLCDMVMDAMRHGVWSYDVWREVLGDMA